MAEKKARIMIVDDASLVRLYYRRIVEMAGHEVDEALNGIEALEKLVQNSDNLPDLLIVDVNMPQMDGLTFLATLRKQSLPLSSIPALVTSSESNQKDIDAARAAGSNYYLVKPVKESVLVEHITIMCGHPT